MNAVALDADGVAAATYAAMRTLPAYAALAQALDATADDDARLALLDRADDATRASALRYIASAADPVMRERHRMLAWLRADPQRMAWAKRYFANPLHTAQFISAFGTTFDPRALAIGKSAVVPFVLWPRQVEMVQFIVERWRNSEPGTIVKSRDIGASWLAAATACTLCLFNPNMVIGFGSAKEDLLDRSNDTNTIFWKMRMFMEGVPDEFRGPWDAKTHAPHLRVFFPLTGASITGSAGDQIGRGGRSSIVFIDEASYLERPALIDAALQANTLCRIDMSSVRGMANSFYDRAHNSAIPRFDFGWRSDPRKTDEWYAAQVAMFGEVIVAQEVDCNWSASLEGIVINAKHVQAAVGLHEKLGIKITGAKIAALDPADRGADKCAFVAMHGVLVTFATQWSGKGGDLFKTTAKAFSLCDELELDGFHFDADGLGACVRGDAAVLNRARDQRRLTVTEYRGSDAVRFPTRMATGTNVKNEDRYKNLKAQAWFHAAYRFEQSYKASIGEKYDADSIVCIDRNIPDLTRLLVELSTPVAALADNGAFKIDKAPEGAMSPNLADALVICLAPRRLPMKITDAALAMASQPSRSENFHIPLSRGF